MDQLPDRLADHGNVWRLRHTLPYYGRISEYELGKREPTLMTILQYACAARVHVEDIIDDELDLPSKLPGNVSYQGLKRKPTSRKRGK